MKKHGVHVRGAWAACAGMLVLSACSGSTDVVGVLPTDVETGVLEGASQSDGSQLEGSRIEGMLGGEAIEPGEFLVVAGMPVPWEGPALDWPFFTVSLRDFFSDASWSGRSGPPRVVERNVIAAMGKSAKPDHIRVVAPKPEVAETLRDVFVDAEVDFDGGMVSRVMRDWRSDVYRVALGPAPCSYAPSHHGGPCAAVPADGLERP